MNKLLITLKAKPALTIGAFVTAVILTFLAVSFALAYPGLTHSTITFYTDYGTPIESVTIKNGDAPAIPETYREYNTFGGWYLDRGHTVPYDGGPLYYNTTLYAKWNTIFTEEFLRSYADSLASLYEQTIGLEQFNFIDLMPIIDDPEFIEENYQGVSAYLFGGTTSDGYGFEMARIAIFDTMEEADRFYSNRQKYDGVDYNNGHSSFIRRDSMIALVPCGNENIFLGTTSEEDGFIYVTDEKRTQVTVMGCTGYRQKIVIPPAYRDLPVTEIGAYAFFGNEMTTIEFGGNIKTIGVMAFAGCMNLERLSLPAGLQMLGNGFAASANPDLVIDTNGSDIFFVEDGALYDSQQGRLLAYFDGNAESFAVREGIVIIDTAAFANKVNLKHVTFPEGLSSIDSYAFFECSSLQDLYFPKSVQYIGQAAFACTGAGSHSQLQSVTFAPGCLLESLDPFVFGGNVSLKNITIPKNAATIFEGAFASCYELERVYFEDGSVLTSIREGAFDDCKMLQEIVLLQGLQKIGDRAFRRCAALSYVGIPSSVTEIGANAFSDCAQLKTADLSKVLRIKNNAFYECAELEEVCLSEQLEYCDETAFNGCTGIKKLVLPPDPDLVSTEFMLNLDAIEEVTLPLKGGNIGTYFGYPLPASLVRITINGCPKEIRSEYFNRLTNVTEINLPDSVEVIGYGAFRDCVALTAFELPASLKTIGASAFSDCTALADIALPKGLEEIGREAFYHCGALVNLTFPDSLKKLGQDAFYSCVLFTSVVLPLGIIYVGNHAFGGCYGIKELTVPLSDWDDADPGFPLGLTQYTEIYDGTFVCNYQKVSILPGYTHISPYALGNFDKLQELNLPQTIARIDNFAFVNLPVLKKLDISMTTDVGAEILSGCTALEELTLSMTEDTSGGTDYKAPWNLAYFFTFSLGPYSSFHNDSLKKLVIKSGNAHFGDTAFRGTNALEEIVLPSTLTQLDNRLFEDCVSLKRIEIPAGVTIIGDKTFYGCTALREVSFPVKIIVGVSAFEDCSALISADFPEGDNVEVRLSTAVFKNCVSLERVSFGDYTLGSIPDNAFKGCTALTSIRLPVGLTAIGGAAFENAGLRSIRIPARVSKIGWAAFRGCNALETLIFENGSGLNEIDGEAFLGCESLSEVRLPAFLELVGPKAFYACTNLKEVYVLREYNYRAGNWAAFATRLSVFTEEGEKVGPFDQCDPEIIFYVPVNNAGVTVTDLQTGAKNGVDAYKDYGIGWEHYKSKITEMPG